MRMTIRKKPKPAPNGVIVCLRPPRWAQERLVLPGGEPRELLHLTLAFLGKASDLSEEGLLRVMAELRTLAGTTPPIEATIGGIGRFSIHPNDAFYASVDAPELPDFRARVVALCQAGGVPPLLNHGFSPHITLKYLHPNLPMPLQRLEPFEVTFDHLEVWAGPRQLAFAFGGQRVEP